MASKSYFINYDKARDACSVIWLSEKYKIDDLQPYIFAIQCDDGENFYDLINAEYPDADGRDDFKTIMINNFAALEGDDVNEYLLCFTAKVSFNLDQHPKFKKALKSSNNQIVARVQFKKNGKPLIDSDGYEEILYDMHSDNFVTLDLIE